MRLTPADVHNVAFKKPSIGKRGYDEDEVDAFLDLVENEFSRLIEENNELSGRLSAYESGEGPAETVGLTKQGISDETAEQPITPAAAVPEAQQEAPAQEAAPQEAEVQQTPVPEAAPLEAAPREAPVQQAPPVPQPTAAAPVQQAPRDHHVQAARLLGLAEETAQRLTSEAADEAESTRAAANAESDTLLTDSKNRSEQMLADAQGRSETMVKDATEQADTLTRDSQLKAEAMDREAQRKYGEVMTQLTEQRTALEKKIDDLRTYEREYRSRLKGWITEQLAQLDEGSASANGGPAKAETPNARQ